ncbi:MAG: sigma-70 family RNA polymerase sigma factor [Alphaproteobacteria bacterium]|nr:MAG: sigma-70 family RNA polymerase sigma factor [Alphaproteobacteria bacterium]
MDSTGHERLRDLYLAHRRRLVRSLSRRLSDDDEAEEVVQEAWARVLSRRGDGGIGDLVRYLYRTARNLAIDRLRHRQVEGRVLGRRLSFVEDEPDGDGDAGRRSDSSDGLAADGRRPELVLMDGGHSPEQAASGRQELTAIAGAINALEPRCRQAFIWHRFHGLGYREIAHRLEVSVSSVEKYIMTALLACREAREAVHEGRWRMPEESGEILSDLLADPRSGEDRIGRQGRTDGLRKRSSRSSCGVSEGPGETVRDTGPESEQP